MENVLSCLYLSCKDEIPGALEGSLPYSLLPVFPMFLSLVCLLLVPFQFYIRLQAHMLQIQDVYRQKVKVILSDLLIKMYMWLEKQTTVESQIFPLPAHIPTLNAKNLNACTFYIQKYPSKQPRREVSTISLQS